MATRTKKSHNLSSYGMNKLRLSLILISAGIGLSIYGWAAAELVTMLFGIFLIVNSSYTIVDLYRLANGKNLH